MTKPNDRITINYKGPEDTEVTSHEVFASAALVRRLASLVQSIGDPTRIWSDPNVQSIMIVDLLAPRTPRGQEVKEYDSEDFEMTVEENDKLLDWAREHVINFFTVATTGLQRAVEKDGSLTTLTESLNGLKDLADKKLSAGHTTANPVT